jgi:hypothetical protein
MKAQAKLERQIAGLGDLSRDELAAMWEKQYGCPPKGIKRGLLERSAAWHLQAKRLGGLSPTARRILKTAEKDHLARKGARWSMATDSYLDAIGSQEPAEDQPSQEINADPTPPILQTRPVAPSRPLPRILSPGSRLLREWNGRMYAVDVLDKGFVMDGKTYRSLSAIAKRITGTDWSGPRFFGL